VRQRVYHVGLPGGNLGQPGLAALARTGVLVGQRARHGTPEQVGGGGDEAVRRELIGDVAQILINPEDGTGQHHGGRPGRGGGQAEIAIEFAALSRRYANKGTWQLPSHGNFSGSQTPLTREGCRRFSDLRSSNSDVPAALGRHQGVKLINPGSARLILYR
jgi:hypothetical protein